MTTEKEGLKTGILNIQDLGFQVNIFEKPNIDKVTIGYDMNLLFDDKEDWIQFIIEAQFINEENNVTFIYSTVLTRFSAENLKQYYVEDSESLELPPNTLNILFGIAFTHARAILAKNLAGTIHSHFYIPIINPGVLFNNLLQRTMDIIKAETNDNLE